ncbi:52 kDa repressor of the inhibitor of the protein kinase [Varanus komodoensis]|nr:52 kDa repressor of the inhibitor of the protein kinase [Varanus komodoensis]
MPNFCAAPNCTRKSTQSDLAFFRFPRDPARELKAAYIILLLPSVLSPHNNPVSIQGAKIGLSCRCQRWVENCRRADLEDKTPDQLNKHYRLCAKHFETSMICRSIVACKLSPYRTVLRDNAVPTIFDLTSHLNNPHSRHRKRIKELSKPKTDCLQLAQELVRATRAASERTYRLFEDLNAEENRRRASERLLTVWSMQNIADSIRSSGRLLRDGSEACSRTFERVMGERNAILDRQTEVLHMLAVTLQGALLGAHSQPVLQPFQCGTPALPRPPRPHTSLQKSNQWGLHPSTSFLPSRLSQALIP